MSAFGRKVLPAAIGLAVTGAVAAPAEAAPGWYAGVGAGQSSVDSFTVTGGQLEAALADLGITADVPSVSSDSSDTGWRLFGGYQFNDYVALEAFYVDLGELDVDLSGTIDGGEGNPNITLTGSAGPDTYGYGIYWVFSYPVFAKFSAFGKIGGIHWTADAPVTLVVDGETGTASNSDDGNDFAWGAGAKYQLTDHIAVDVQFEQFTTIEDIDLITGNVRWTF